MATGLNSLLYTARDALAAQTFGLSVTGQNVSNVNTEGYVRRDPLLQTRALGDYGTVQVAGLRRATDLVTERRHYEARGLGSAATEQHFHLTGMEALFNDFAGSGLGSSLDALFASFASLAAAPSDPTTRLAALGSADAFARRIRSTANALAKTRDELLSKAQDVTADVNDKATVLAELNRKIQVARAAGQNPADLEDERGRVLLDLSELVDIRTFEDGDGDLVIQASGGVLVEGSVARQIAVGLDAGGAIQVVAQGPSGAGSDVTQFLTGGVLAGIREARDVDAASVLSDLDQLAFDVANAVNTQHASGFGLDGVSGRNLFTVSATVAGAARSLAMDPSMVGQPDRLAASASAAALPGGSANATALAALADAKIASGGTRTAQEAYSDLVGDVGARTQRAASTAEMQDAMTEQIYAMRESVGGVSLDEEMVSLSRYQRAYEAAAMVLQTADKLLEELTRRVGR